MEAPQAEYHQTKFEEGGTAMSRSEELTYMRETDTKIAAAFDAAWLLKAALQTERKSLAKYQRLAKQSYLSSTQKARYEGWIKQVEERITELEPKVSAAWADATNLNGALYGGWPRFFHVIHLHRTTHCSSFRPTTRIGWVPALSGLTEAEAVAEHGTSLCTKCFPSAPVELTQDRVDPDVCPSSGKSIARPASARSYSRSVYVTCPTCNQIVQRTSTGLIRKHKR